MWREVAVRGVVMNVSVWKRRNKSGRYGRSSSGSRVG
jgi:hypothetical protein